jgi:ABC-type transporter MlaC component
MVYINYNNLDDETQQRLVTVSKKDVEQKFGNDLKRYTEENHIEYDTLLEEVAIRNLYSYDYVFNI